MFRSFSNLVASPEIDQPKAPIDTMAGSFVGVGVSCEREITERTWLDENVAFGDGAVDPAFFMESEDERSSFAPVDGGRG